MHHWDAKQEPSNTHQGHGASQPLVRVLLDLGIRVPHSLWQQTTPKRIRLHQLLLFGIVYEVKGANNTENTQPNSVATIAPGDGMRRVGNPDFLPSSALLTRQILDDLQKAPAVLVHKSEGARHRVPHVAVLLL